MAMACQLNNFHMQYVIPWSLGVFNQYTTSNFGHRNFVVYIDLAFTSVYINNKISMTEVEGSNRVTMVHMLYTLVWGQIFSEIC